MQFLFTVGVEGTGHHLIGTLLSDYGKRNDSIFEGEWHKPLYEHWDFEVRWKNAQKKSISSEYKELQKKLRSAFNKHTSQQIVNCFEYTSFPYEQPRESLRRPDLIEFSDLMAEFKDVIDVKYLVLYRDPIETTYSAIRRGFTDNVYLQAKIIESNHINLERQFSQMPDADYKVMHFDKFLNQPEAHLKKLADWWNLDYETVAQGLTRIRKPSGVAGVNDEIVGFLKDFFNEKRIQQWTSFYNGSNQLLED